MRMNSSKNFFTVEWALLIRCLIYLVTVNVVLSSHFDTQQKNDRRLFGCTVQALDCTPCPRPHSSPPPPTPPPTPLLRLRRLRLRLLPPPPSPGPPPSTQ